MRKILCLDFDGVCHSYKSGWKGAHEIPDPPVDGLYEFLAAAVKEFDVQIFSSRSHQPGGVVAMRNWFLAQAPDDDARQVVEQLKFPLEKPPAFVSLDDRVLTFRGKWPSILELVNFTPWNAKTV